MTLLLGCGTSVAAPTVPCPVGHVRDPERAERLMAVLERAPAGAALSPLLARTEGMCFSPDAIDVVTTERVLLLSTRSTDEEAAARIGHLLVHVRDGLPLGDLQPGADCDAEVERALRLESVAYVTEVRLQAALGARPTLRRFEFEGAIAPLDDAAAAEHVLSYLRAHPTGAPGIDGLAAGYRTRCETER